MYATIIMFANDIPIVSNGMNPVSDAYDENENSKTKHPALLHQSMKPPPPLTNFILRISSFLNLVYFMGTRQCIL